MKPSCKLSNTWPSIKPRGCKIHSKSAKHKQSKATVAVRAASTPKIRASIGETASLPNRPHILTPVAVASSAPSVKPIDDDLVSCTNSRKHRPE